MIVVLSAAIAALGTGCGATRRSAVRATRAILRGDGIGTVRFGASPAAVAESLGRTFGPPVGADQIPHGYGHALCGFRPEDWNGLGATSDGKLFVAQLTAWFRAGRFVGYDYGPNNFQTKLDSWRSFAGSSMMLATVEKVTVGDPLSRARRRYGHDLGVSTRMQGRPPDPRLMRLPVWTASTRTGPVTGWIGLTDLRAGRRLGLYGDDRQHRGGRRWLNAEHALQGAPLTDLPQPHGQQRRASRPQAHQVTTSLRPHLRPVRVAAEKSGSGRGPE
jgi:hypothetical protein